MKIILKNCNNIDEAKIDIKENELNIKYAINGTGKSTIAHAIQKKVVGEELASLQPFKYLNDGMAEHNPSIEIKSKEEIKRVLIFNEEYISEYEFCKTELIANSFEIFVKTSEYDKNMAEIEKELKDIRDVFQSDENLEKLINDLFLFIDSFGTKTKKGKCSKSSDIYKSIGEGNKLQNIPEEIGDYTEFLQNSAENANVKWLKWQLEGGRYSETSSRCPYCVGNIESKKEKINKVGEIFNEKYLKILVRVLEVYHSLIDYFSDSTKEQLEKIFAKVGNQTEDELDYLIKVYEEAERLKQKLEQLKNLRFEALKDITSIENELEEKRIDLDLYSHFNSSSMKEKIDILNQSLKLVQEKAGLLKGKVKRQKDLLKNTITNYQNEINEFLLNAGYVYKVEIKENENSYAEDQYHLILRYGDKEVLESEKHLSYGERNAFALVLFMYQALKEDADLIVLDDPISSFDNNKKYAIMERLFHKGKNSFRDKTVLFLTHDYQPIIDTYNLSGLFSKSNIMFLQNIDGLLNEVPIIKDDIKSCISICTENIKAETEVLIKLVYLRRLLEIEEQKECWGYQILSNIFHGRPKPLYKKGDEEREMSEEEIVEGIKEIKGRIEEFEYEDIIKMVLDKKKLIELYKNGKCGYDKMQIYRILAQDELEQERGSVCKKFLDESFHIENDYLFQLNPRKFPLIPNYIIEDLDKRIDALAED